MTPVMFGKVFELKLVLDPFSLCLTNKTCKVHQTPQKEEKFRGKTKSFCIDIHSKEGECNVMRYGFVV